jgi:hypothetical protein
MSEVSGLLLESPSKVSPFSVRYSQTWDCQKEGRAWARRYLKLVVMAFILHMTSAALFIGLVDRQVYDDKYNMHDVVRYARDGLSAATVRSHLNPPGPTSFLWMAAGVRLLGGGELHAARIANLLSWVLLFVGILVGARYSTHPQIWYAALLATLVFPHSVLAAATTLTEGPALLFATLGTLLWIESASRPTVNASSFLTLILAGLSMGIAVSCRQYYLALFPAAALFSLLQLRGPASNAKFVRLAAMILSLSVVSIPVIVLIHIWGSMTSPGAVLGTSFADWKSYVGWNVFRPLVAIFYCSFYLLPLTLPAVWRFRPAVGWLALVGASIAGVAAAGFAPSLLQPGPFSTVIRLATPRPGVEFLLLACIAALMFYNAVLIGMLLWQNRQILRSCPALIFALLTLVFFVLEQLGVGGNVPFYDRYVLQIAPFLGIIAFSLAPRLGFTRLLTLAVMDVFAHILLWSHAFHL